MIETPASSVLFIRGLPGSGKSTLACQLVSKLGYVHIEADEFFTFGNSYKFDRSCLDDAHFFCKLRLHLLLQQKTPLICVANTFIKRSHIGDYVDICAANKAQYALVEMRGRFNSVHDVPQERMNKMKAEWEEIHTILHLEPEAFFPLEDL